MEDHNPDYKNVSEDVFRQLKTALKERIRLERQLAKFIIKNPPHPILARKMVAALEGANSQRKSMLDARNCIPMSERFERQSIARSESINHASAIDKQFVIDSEGRQVTVRLIEKKTLIKKERDDSRLAKSIVEAGELEPLFIQWLRDKEMPERIKRKAERRKNLNWNNPKPNLAPGVAMYGDRG